MAKLQSLVLWENGFEGAVPASLAGMEALEELRLSENPLMTTFDPEMLQPPRIGLRRWQCNVGSNSWQCPVPDWARDQCMCSCTGSARGRSHRANGTASSTHQVEV